MLDKEQHSVGQCSKPGEILCCNMPASRCRSRRFWRVIARFAASDAGILLLGRNRIEMQPVLPAALRDRIKQDDAERSG
jgi:hypothetical protein